jgi:hypothetical protein
MRIVKLIAIIILAMSSWSLAYAQKTTERFIPIGKSPGLSGKFTLIGKIAAVDPQRKTLVCADSTGRHTVKVIEQTRIWLDQSQLNQTNQTGALADCQTGRLVEVKFVDKERKEGPAEWIKVGVGGYGSAARQP